MDQSALFNFKIVERFRNVITECFTLSFFFFQNWPLNSVDAFGNSARKCWFFNGRTPTGLQCRFSIKINSAYFEGVKFICFNSRTSPFGWGYKVLREWLQDLVRGDLIWQTAYLHQDYCHSPRRCDRGCRPGPGWPFYTKTRLYKMRSQPSYFFFEVVVIVVNVVVNLVAVRTVFYSYE